MRTEYGFSNQTALGGVDPVKKTFIIVLCFLLMLCCGSCREAGGKIPEIVKNTPGSEKWNDKTD